MTTTSFDKAKRVINFTERTTYVTITMKEWNGTDIVTVKRSVKAWEANNMLASASKLTFVKLTIA